MNKKNKIRELEALVAAQHAEIAMWKDKHAHLWNESLKYAQAYKLVDGFKNEFQSQLTAHGINPQAEPNSPRWKALLRWVDDTYDQDGSAFL